MIEVSYSGILGRVPTHPIFNLDIKYSRRILGSFKSHKFLFCVHNTSLSVMALSQTNRVVLSYIYFKTCLILSLSLFVLSLFGFPINTEHTFLRSLMCTARSINSIYCDLVMQSTDLCNLSYAIFSIPLFHALSYGHKRCLNSQFP